jgi:hypothetical protein
MKVSFTHAAIATLCVTVSLFLVRDYQQNNDAQAASQIQQQQPRQQLQLPALDLPANSLISDRVIELPEDGQSYYLTVFTNTNPTPQERVMLSWFQSDTSLASLKAQTHWNHYTPALAMYRTRFASAVPENQFPAIMLQGPDQYGNHGKVVFKCASHNIPDSPQALVAMIRNALGRPCPRPDPAPTPTPEPNPNPNPIPVIPDIGPQPLAPTPPAEEPTNVLGLAAIASLITAAIAAYLETKNRVKM